MFLFDSCLDLGLEVSKHLMLGGITETLDKVICKNKNTPIINSVSNILAKGADAGWEKLKDKKIGQKKLPNGLVKSVDCFKSCLKVDKLLNNANSLITYPFKKTIDSQIIDCENELKSSYGDKFSKTSIQLTQILVHEILKLKLPVLQGHLESVIKINLLSIFSNLATAQFKTFNDHKNSINNVSGTIIDALIILLVPFQDRLNQIDQLNQKERLKKYNEISIEIYDHLIKLCFPKGEDSFIYPFESGKDAVWLILSTGNLPVDGEMPNQTVNLKNLFAKQFCKYLDYSRSYRLAQKEKDILQENLREFPIGQLLVQGCQSLTQDILTEIKNAIQEFDSLISELNQKVFNGKLNGGQIERLSKRIKESKNLTAEKLFDLCDLFDPLKPDEEKTFRKILLKDFVLRFEKIKLLPSGILGGIFKSKAQNQIINELNKELFAVDKSNHKKKLIELIHNIKHLTLNEKLNQLNGLFKPLDEEEERNKRIDMLKEFVKRFENLQSASSNINEQLVHSNEFNKIIDELNNEFFKEEEKKIIDCIKDHEHLTEKLFKISLKIKHIYLEDEKIEQMNVLIETIQSFIILSYSNDGITKKIENDQLINALNNKLFNGELNVDQKKELMDCIHEHRHLTQKLFEIRFLSKEYSLVKKISGFRNIKKYVNQLQNLLIREPSSLENFLFSLLQNFLHENDSGFNHFWEMTENHIDTFFLYVTHQFAKEYVNNFNEIKNILHEKTQVQDVIEENFNDIIEFVGGNGNINEDKLENKDIEEHENIKKYKKIFDLILKQKNNEIFAIPDKLQKIIRDEGEQQVLNLSKQYENYKKFHALKKDLSDEVAPSLPFNEIIQETGNILSFLLKQGGKSLYCKNKDNEIIVLKVIQGGLSQFLENAKTVSIFKKILSTPETVNEFERFCLDPNYIELFGFKTQIFEMTQETIEVKLRSALVSFCKEKVEAVEKKPKLNLEKTDPSETEQELTYQKGIEKLLNLFIKTKSKESNSLTGLEALFELFPQIPAPLIQKLWNWMIEEFSGLLPQFLDFSHERMEFVFRTLNKELTKPIIFDPSKGKSKKAGSDNEWKTYHEKFIHTNSTKILSDLLGLLKLQPLESQMNKIPGFSEFSIKNTIEDSAFGEFVSELFTNIANIGLNLSIDVLKNEPTIKPEDKKTLEDLQKEVIQNGIHYPFRFLGAFIEHVTDIFGNTIWNDLRLVMLFIGACIIKGLGYLFKATHLEDLLVDFIFKMTKQSLNKAIDDFKTSSSDDNILYQLLEIFEGIESHHFHQKTEEPLVVNIG
ncbi:MAG: hypothetical protein Q8K60_06540 [Parachlamydiaceae bacterium]|nr:hypothetical protein [Parachlamydiaceae bacterium]